MRFFFFSSLLACGCEGVCVCVRACVEGYHPALPLYIEIDGCVRACVRACFKDVYSPSHSSLVVIVLI